MEAEGFRTRSDLSRASGVSEAVLSRWFRGEVVPDLENLRKVARPLRRPLLELVVAAGHLSAEEAKVKTVSAPPAVHHGVPTEGLDEARERQLREYAEFLRLQQKAEGKRNR